MNNILVVLILCVLFILVWIVICCDILEQYHLRINVPRMHAGFLVIPPNLFFHWHTSDMPAQMRANITTMETKYPNFTVKCFDTQTGLLFLKEHFDDDVVNSYLTLKPQAYKSDLLRYCLLYIKGGIYLDIKYNTYGDFNLKELMYAEHFCEDFIFRKNIYNASIVTKPHNPILGRAISKIVENVNNRYYGKNPLAITGPHMLGQLITPDERRQLVDLYHSLIFFNVDKRIVTFKRDGKNKTRIIQSYSGYIKQKTKIGESYIKMWKTKNVFNENINALSTFTLDGALH